MSPHEVAHLTCIYCDDVREEANRKTSFMGCYPNHPIKLPADSPLAIDQLCIVGIITLRPPFGFEKLRVEVCIGDEDPHTVEMPPSMLARIKADADKRKAASGDQSAQLRTTVHIKDITVKEPSKAFMRLMLDDTEVMGNALVFSR